MKTNIIFSFALIIGLGLTISSHAQHNVYISPEEKALETASHMQKRLGLKENQTEQVYSLNLTKIQKSRSLSTQKEIGQADLSPAYQQIREDYDLRLRSILTPDQYQRWEILKEEAEMRRKNQLLYKKEGGTKAFITINKDPESDLEGIVAK